MKSEYLVKKLCVSAVMLALSTVLGLITVIKMPMGGSVTPFSMVPLILISFMYGIPWGAGCGVIYAVLQAVIDMGMLLSYGYTPFTLIGSLVLDYLLAFSVLCLAPIFKKRGTVGIVLGTALAVGLRFICHFLSG
ncbi:MAG: energy-coupled thiamine transporter ThiT, partial [Oscillospiraceae bacterium]|nr:energy-coupled thiamine transporter ThiT [Candidatus Equicaccousia limihippi]